MFRETSHAHRDARRLYPRTSFSPGPRLASGWLLAMGVLAVPAGRAAAADIHWTSAAGGNWNVAANWGGAVPGAGDNAIIDLDGTYTVTMDVNPTVASLSLGASSGTQTLSMTGRTLTLNGPAASAVNTNGVLVCKGGCTIANTAGAFGVERGTVLIQGESNNGNATLTAAAGFTNNGTLTLDSTSSHSANLIVTAGTLTNAPGGIISVVAGSGGARTITAQLDNQGTININKDTTVNKDSANHISSGTINVSGGNLGITYGSTAPTFTNTGQITIAASRTLNVFGATAFNQNGGNINIVGSFIVNPNVTSPNATLTLNGGTLGGTAIARRSNLIFGNPGTTGGTVCVRDTTSTYSGNLPAGMTVIVQGDFSGDGHATLTAAQGFTNYGTLTLDSLTGNYNATLVVTSGTLTNAGTINSDATTGGNRTITAQLDNQGTININKDTTVNKDSANHISSGTINVSGGNLTVNQSGTTPTFTNTGTFSIAATRTLNLNGGTFTNFAANTLTGGTYNIAGTLRFDNAAIATNAANIILDGASSAIVNQSGANALAGFATNAAGGSFTIKNGRNYARTGTFTNAGLVTVGPGASTLSATADYVQTGGGTMLDGGTLDPNNLVDLQGGFLKGNGTVAANLASAALVQPGLSAGCLAVTGDYTQSGGGLLEIEKAGPDACGSPTPQYDRLTVSGTASLDGGLTVTLLGGYEPAVGTTFDIVVAAAVSGQFSNTNLPVNFANNCKALPEYGPTYVRLTAVQGGLFIQQPQSQTICAGDPVAFSVAVAGEPPFTYQWRKDGLDIPGATADTLVIDPVTPADAGAYDCVVENVCGSRFSAVATLAVNVAPTVSQPPVSQTVCAGESVMFSVQADGVPAPTFQWRHDGQDIPGATMNSYTLAATTPGDAGTYEVVVSNVCGTVTPSASLTVHESPQITMPPEPQVACVGGAVTFTLTATGVPAPAIQWRHDGQDIPGATQSSLTIDPAALTDAGAYEAIATNSCGVAGGSATLQVFASGSGDGDGDGAVTGADVQGFINALFLGGPPSAGTCAYDMNVNGAVDDADTALFVAALLTT